MKNVVIVTMDRLSRVEEACKATCLEEGLEVSGFHNVHIPVAEVMLKKYPEDDPDIMVLYQGGTDIVELFKEELNERYPERKINIQAVEYEDWMDCIEVFKSIRSLKEDLSHLWLDGQGPKEIMHSIVSLAKTYAIDLEKVYSLQHGPEGLVVVDESGFLKTFDFFNSTRDFDRMADVEALEGCCGAEFSNVIQAMKKVVLGCESCDPYKYRSGVKELKKALDEVAPGYERLADYIRAGYGNLLSNDEIDSLAIVKRFVAKHMYLHAIECMDALMPETYVSKGLLRFNQKSDNAKWARKEDKLAHIQIVNYMFGKLLATQIWYFESGDKSSINALTELARLQSKFLRSIETGSFNYTWAGLVNNVSKSWTLSETVRGKNVKPKYPFTCFMGMDLEKRAAVGYLLMMHKALKNGRNFCDYTSEKKADVESIKTVLNMYCALAEYVLK